ncbi:MAG: hypothetical protein U0835_17065 [Isosphaeraceae bacterium]
MSEVDLTDHFVEQYHALDRELRGLRAGSCRPRRDRDGPRRVEDLADVSPRRPINSPPRPEGEKAAGERDRLTAELQAARVAVALLEDRAAQAARNAEEQARQLDAQREECETLRGRLEATDASARKAAEEWETARRELEGRLAEAGAQIESLKRQLREREEKTLPPPPPAPSKAQEQELARLRAELAQARQDVGEALKKQADAEWQAKQEKARADALWDENHLLREEIHHAGGNGRPVPR